MVQMWNTKIVFENKQGVIMLYRLENIQGNNKLGGYGPLQS